MVSILSLGCCRSWFQASSGATCLPVTVMSVGQQYKKTTKGVKLVQSRYQ